MARVLVTGITGNVGAALLRVLMEEAGHHVHVLVRASSFFEGMNRLQEVGMMLGVSERRLSERVTVHVGDLGEPSFGLAPQEYDELCGQVEVIVHAAASLSLKLSYEDARAATLRPAREVIDLALQAPKMRRFVLVSTVGVGGVDFHSVPETLPLNTRNFRNNYERVKCACERETLSLLEGKVETVVVRPSMVVGDSVSGVTLKPQIFASICHLLAGGLTGGLIPDLRTFHLDPIPSDTLARALALLVGEHALPARRVLHLCSGPLGRISFNALQEIVAANSGDTGKRKLVRLQEFHAALPLIMNSSSESERKKIAFLPFFLDYFSFDQQFENSATVEYLAAAGIPIPPAAEYLSHSVQYAFQSRRRARNVTRGTVSNSGERAGNE